MNSRAKRGAQSNLDISNYDAARDQGWLTPLCADSRLAISTKLVGTVIARQFFNRDLFNGTFWNKKIPPGKLIAWCKPRRIRERCGGTDDTDGIGLSTVYGALIELEEHGYIIRLAMAGLIEEKPTKKVGAIIARPQQPHASAYANASQPGFQKPEGTFQKTEFPIPESGPDSIDCTLNNKSIESSSIPPSYDAAREANGSARPPTAPLTDGERSALQRVLNKYGAAMSGKAAKRTGEG